MFNLPLFAIPGIRSLLRGRRWIFFCIAGCTVFLWLPNVCRAQAYTPLQREWAQAMLRDVSDDVQKNYYDPNLHGVDWSTKVHETQEKIDKADSLNRALTAIAALVDSLNDSHTFFLPPPRDYVHDYGFQIQMIGDRCLVTRVRPGGDAETKGLRPGDEILAVNGYKPTRDDFWRLQFVFWVLRPQHSLQLNIRTPGGSEREIEVVASFRQLPKIKNFYEMNSFDVDRIVEEEKKYQGVSYQERGYDLLIVKLSAFLPFSDETDAILDKMRYHKAVILDLRGNLGGAASMVQSVLGEFLDHKVKIGNLVQRNTSTPVETGHHFHPFTGQLIVLIDSRSASAAELFARVIQLEKRGVVIGDRSSGSVMEAMRFIHKTKGSTGDSFVLYGAEVTVADLIMADGQSLEHRGVIPDETILPTASDLADNRDPVLSNAARMANVDMSPEEAGKLFPYEWPKQ